MFTTTLATSLLTGFLLFVFAVSSWMFNLAPFLPPVEVTILSYAPPV